jgi:hypothetical protein
MTSALRVSVAKQQPWRNYSKACVAFSAAPLKDSMGERGERFVLLVAEQQIKLID